MARSNPESYVESTIKKDIWKHRPVNKVDGLGHSNLGTDVITINASSGQKNEEFVHTKDNTLRSIHGSICALETSLRRYPQ